MASALLAQKAAILLASFATPLSVARILVALVSERGPKKQETSDLYRLGIADSVRIRLIPSPSQKQEMGRLQEGDGKCAKKHASSLLTIKECLSYT